MDIAKPDTQMLNDGKRMLIKQEYTITSFDSALYYLPPFEVMVNGESYRSKALAVKVYSIPVDTLHPEQFFGPKTVREVPITWDDVSAIVWLTLLMLALGGLAYYLFVRYKDNKPIIKKIKIEPKLPPHQQALKEICLLYTSDLFWREGLTLVTAESCTAGSVAAAITAVAGSSQCFKGGIIALSLIHI